MFQSLMSLGQTGAAPSNGATEMAVMMLVLLIVAIAWAGWERVGRQKAERGAAALQASAAQIAAQTTAQAAAQRVTEDGQRNAVMFEQHRKLNDLQIAKLTGEIELLKRQAGRPSDEDKDRLEAAKEYHELMVEKARLEMDSLRLHIAEQRRRIDDWRAGME